MRGDSGENKFALRYLNVAIRLLISRIRFRARGFHSRDFPVTIHPRLETDRQTDRERGEVRKKMV